MMVGLIVLQGIASAFNSRQIYDDNGDPIDFTKWPLDSLQRFTDSMLVDVQIDSVAEEFIFIEVADSIQHPADSVMRVILQRDSTARAKIEFDKWFSSLTKKEQKKWIVENVEIPRKIHRADSILARKDSIKARKDSITAATPRVLETSFISDTLRYRRLLKMSQDKKFGDIRIEKFDTTYNSHYYDYPFFKQDMNATWAGVSGSPVQLYNVYHRPQEENATFFTPYQSWTFTPDNIPMYNTKTPYTELAYYGTLIAGQAKEELNARVMTTQNITPALNITIEINKFGGAGMLMNEKTDFNNLALSGNYLGKKYAAHAGWIRDKIVRTENGGVRDNLWIRDTTVASKEIEVNLAKASNTILRNTVFLNQNFRVSFGNDSLTTMFIGHSLDWSSYKKSYSDAINDKWGKEYYRNTFLIDPNKSLDTLKVNKFDNKFYVRLQPWKEDAAISKIDVGVGDKLLNYYDQYKVTDDAGSRVFYKKLWQNNVYAYAGARGQVMKYFNWNADAKIYFAGYQAGDMDINADAKFNFYPFRKARKSPVSISGNFHYDLTRPDHYQQRIFTNHYSWDNNFDRVSTMRFAGKVDIPYWKFDVEVGYTMLGNMIYYNNDSQIAQSGHVVNVLTASINKEFDFKWLHLDNRILVQYSSDNDVVPVPLVALNLRWWFEFNIVKQVMRMQIGANALYNTLWRMPGYNPNLGVFYNQTAQTYGNCPYIDAFVNVQWKRACIFIKVENVNQGWPSKSKDYFTAHSQIHTQRTLKLGITWPFYIQPAKRRAPIHDHDHDHGGHDHDHDHGQSTRQLGARGLDAAPSGVANQSLKSATPARRK